MWSVLFSQATGGDEVQANTLMSWCCCRRRAPMCGPDEAGHSLSITTTSSTTPIRPSETPPVNLPLSFSSSLPLLAVAMGCRRVFEGWRRLGGGGQWRKIGIEESEEGQKRRWRMRKIRRKTGGRKTKERGWWVFLLLLLFP